MAIRVGMANDKKSGRQRGSSSLPSDPRIESAFGEPRNFFNNRFVYLVVSQRARGLSIGINMNPDQNCNFRCVYCEVYRNTSSLDPRVNPKIMTAELRRLLTWVQEDKIQDLEPYHQVPRELLRLKEVALSGNGEPTLCPNFCEVVQSLIHLRATGAHPFFKIVLITNGTGLDQHEVQKGLQWFTVQDEVWIKLDAGSQEHMDRINRAKAPLSRILDNILLLGKQRPIVIQSLFPLLHEQEPTAEEIEAYVQRLQELTAGGANISQVQVYSAHRPTALPDCRHLSLPCLSRIAHRVRAVTGLPVEVF